MKQLTRIIPFMMRVRGRRDQGMATAEYAIGTVAVMSFGSLILKILNDPTIRDLIMKFISWVVESIIGLIGG